jgi:hypothetical protein
LYEEGEIDLADFVQMYARETRSRVSVCSPSAGHFCSRKVREFEFPHSTSAPHCPQLFECECFLLYTFNEFPNPGADDGTPIPFVHGSLMIFSANLGTALRL